MKTIQTKAGKLIVLEVPEDATEFWLSFDAVCFKTNGRYDCVKRSDCFIENYTRTLQFTSKILGKLSELSEEECLRFSTLHPHSDEYIELAMSPLFLIHCRKQYKNASKMFDNGTESPKLSLISLLQSNGIDISKNLLLIEVL